MAIPEAVVIQVTSLKNDIAQGKAHPFTGPIKAQDGSILVAKRETLKDIDLLKMNVYVEGVEGKLPN